MTRSTATWMIAACFVAASLLHAAPPSPTQHAADGRLAPVLSRAADYVDGFTRQFLTIVAEERYTQAVQEKPAWDSGYVELAS